MFWSWPPAVTGRCRYQSAAGSFRPWKTVAPRDTKPGDALTYTVTVTNKSTDADYTGASFTDDLSGVLDDATYNGDARAGVGTVSYARPRLTWTGDLPGGAVATVTYSVKVAKPPRGDKKLRNKVTSPDQTNCPLPMPRSGRSARAAIDPRCTTTTPVQSLTLRKTASPSTKVQPGGTVTYTLTITNTGATAYDRAVVRDNLTRVLDDARYNGDATATAGAIAVSGSRLTWSGPLAAGESVTVTYSVTVDAKPKGDRRLRNAVTTTAPGGTCVIGTEPGCTTTTIVRPPTPVLPPTGNNGIGWWGAGLAVLLTGAGALLFGWSRRREHPSRP
ncbi:hypothetical protein ACFWZ2_13310 [Streptomyces sp. NPDC059002]|uniref:DUF7927 domain-containing protein n=1 Tax=Streptomyces sp. NPDC059002 TaxID=3346690 RepID=UPI003694756F